MIYSQSILKRDVKRADILDAVQQEKEVMFGLFKFLFKIRMMDKRTTGTLMYKYDGRMQERQKELFERTKNELLET